MSALDGSHKAVKVVLPGRFWDSQLYSGALFLFGRSGELIELSWDKLVADLPVPDDLHVAMKLVLTANHHLYEPGARLLLLDPEVRALLRTKFDSLCFHLPWTVSLTNPNTQDNPFPFPHNDSDVHYRHLFVAGSDGLFSLPTFGDDEMFQVSDVPTFTIAAKFRTVAQAAGSEGLLAAQMSRDVVGTDRIRYSLTRVSETPCVSCEWGSSAIIASGLDNSIYIAPYREPRSSRTGVGLRPQRQFEPIIREEEIFGEDVTSARGYSWGAGDKIFRFGPDRHIHVLRFQKNRGALARFSTLDDVPVEQLTDDNSVVTARTSAFGSVVEVDDGLVIMLTRGGSLSIPGEPTNWRVFPRSSNYLNHLHIIYEDRLEIWAFTHDYFVEPNARMVGLDVD